MSTNVDGRADLYSLGCVGYYVLTGRHVFDGDTVMQVFAQHLQSVPTPPSQRGPFAVPPELEQLILSCLAKKPEDRPQSAAELDRRLAAVNGEQWTDAHAREWWATTKTPAGEPDERIETQARGRAPGESGTRLAVDQDEASDAPTRAGER